jgi:ATP-dependent helicase/nuclease subunit B
MFLVLLCTLIRELLMNRLLDDLAEICDRHPLSEKRLVAPSLAIGHQIAEGLVREGHPWLNLHIETVYTLARTVIASDLVHQGLRVLSRAQAQALIEQICAEVLGRKSYFGALRLQPGFHRILRTTIEDLRRSDITADELLADPAEDRTKIDDIQAIAQAYDRILAENRFVDEAELVRRAMRKLEKCQARESKPPIYLLPAKLELSPGERALIDRLAGGCLHVLAVDQPSGWEPTGSSFHMFRALGEENEIREVFRRLLRDGIELDRAEILYTDQSTYLPLIYELSAQYELPCTYGEGIPVLFSRPGQAALQYLDWLDGDYDAHCFRRMVEADVLDFRGIDHHAKAPRAMDATRIIRDAGIGRGRDRYLPSLDALIRVYQERTDEKRDNGNGDEDRNFHVRQINTARAVYSLIDRILSVTPDTGRRGAVSLGALAAGLARFVAAHARIAGELDGMATAGLEQLCDEFAELPVRQLSIREAIRRLRRAVRILHVGASVPKPGHLHASDYGAGGYSGRAYTFIVGMDESRHPGRGLQDPILLDHERRRINRLIHPRHLRILSDRPAERKQAFRSCLARLQGQVFISYSCRDLLADREQFPVPVLLEIYRAVSRKPDMDYSGFRSALDPACGFIPGHDMFLDETEWWLHQRHMFPWRAGSQRAMVESVYPWLRRGRQAEQERSGNRFTVFDGWVRDAEGELDPRRALQPISPTQIEALARCPFAYLLRYVLGVTPPDDWSRDTTVWLDPAALGRLLHDIFRDFMSEITVREEKPRFEQHWARLKGLAEASIEHWRERVPPPNMAAFSVQRDHILIACETFLKEEEIHCQDITPRFFEVPFGLRDMQAALSPGSERPVLIDLGEGTGFLLRGRVDRVDQRRDGEYEVWDYKTGSPRPLREEKRYNRGQQIQHALYARAVEILLARMGGSGRVVCSGYFFPGPRGEGMRIIGRDDTEGLQQVISALFDLLQTGAFPSTLDADFCRYCHYRSVCGGPERTHERIVGKVENEEADSSALDPFRRLIHGDN